MYFYPTETLRRRLAIIVKTENERKIYTRIFVAGGAGISIKPTGHSHTGVFPIDYVQPP